jgi:hypothetical protein
MMHSRIITGGAFLMGALLTGCGAESGPTAESTALTPNTPVLSAGSANASSATHTKLVEQFEEPLMNPCNGEVIVFTGVARSQINDIDGLHVEFLTRASGNGTGPESGASYHYELTAYENTNWTRDRLDGTFGAGANARMISSVPELTFTAHFRFHGVLLPSGAFTVTRNLDRVECKA